MADQRKAIILGLRESVVDFRASLPGATEQDILNLVLMTQYFDTLKDLGQSSKSNTIMVPHSPGAVGDIMQQITSSIVMAGKVEDKRV
jgi:NADPH-dependent curcumin reductase CurA